MGIKTKMVGAVETRKKVYEDGVQVGRWACRTASRRQRALDHASSMSARDHCSRQT